MKINILIVDNDESLIKILSAFLSKDKMFSTLTALDGSKALEIVKNHKIDLVIIDLNMPGMSGIDFLSELRNKLPEIKSIILTGYSDIDSYIETIELGAHEYLNKPVDLFLLKKVIKKLLNI